MVRGSEGDSKSHGKQEQHQDSDKEELRKAAEAFHNSLSMNRMDTNKDGFVSQSEVNTPLAKRSGDTDERMRQLEEERELVAKNFDKLANQYKDHLPEAVISNKDLDRISEDRIAELNAKLYQDLDAKHQPAFLQAERNFSAHGGRIDMFTAIRQVATYKIRAEDLKNDPSDRGEYAALSLKQSIDTYMPVALRAAGQAGVNAFLQAVNNEIKGRGYNYKVDTPDR